MSENIIKALNVILALLPIAGILSVFLCRKNYPNKFWLALVFSALLGPFGHFYIKKGMSYAFSIILFAILMLGVTENEALFLGINSSFSIALMILRFKSVGIKESEQVS